MRNVYDTTMYETYENFVFLSPNSKNTNKINAFRVDKTVDKNF